ncbi:hypothetical protein AB9F46_08535 [Rhizobium leguminosarum]|uniref:hypothetical protein n=1 Tax=Rhizobium leguminosarum TaxID=384 RepID=UPI003F9BDB3F
MDVRDNPSRNMDEDLLREISEKYLLPFFSGAMIGNSISSSPFDRTTAFLDPQTIGFKVHRTDTYRLLFRRDQPFAQKGDSAREARVLEAFVTLLGRMSTELQGPLKEDLLSTFQRRIVSEASTEPGEGDNLLKLIDQMALWASRLYEGAPITSAIGIDPAVQGSRSLPLSSIAGEDFFAVLSNGIDSMLTLSRHLNLTGHIVLGSSPSESGYCPWRYTAIANWTSSGNGRIAVVLNRLGEILIFRDGQLLFARRGGNWHFLTHAPVLRQMPVPKTEAIRQAIYETALDASFARTGACIGVIASGRAKMAEEMIAETDILANRLTNKSKALGKIIAGKKFHELDRTLRQELVAIDGATVVDHSGNIVSVGAILKLRGGSTNGGRTAAAKQLADLGMGVKVSQDGGITGYRSNKSTEDSERLAFRVM